MLSSLTQFLLDRPDSGWGWVFLGAKWLAVIAAVVVPAFVLVSVCLGVDRPKIALRYLRRKLTPLLALLAVTLCTAMVIVVNSVMGGFLDMMRQTTRTLEGDLILSAGSSIGGFPHYDEFILELQQVAEVEAATPIITAWGLIRLGEVDYPVEFQGIRPREYARVVKYEKALYWSGATLRGDLAALCRDRGVTEAEVAELRDLVARYQYVGMDPPAHWDPRDPRPRWPAGDPAPADVRAARARARLSAGEFEELCRLVREVRVLDQRLGQADLVAAGMDLRAPAQWQGEPPLSACVVGVEVDRNNRRSRKGLYSLLNNTTLGQRAVITVLPVTQQGGIKQPEPREMMVVNEFKSGLYAIDDKRVYVPFEVLQRMLAMDATRRSNPDLDEAAATQPATPPEAIAPARASSVLIRGRPGVPLETLRRAVLARAQALVERHPLELSGRLDLLTWEQRHVRYLSAVENEKSLVTFLFGFISIVAVIMIGAILYMIVLEKTRDIGVLRALGASRSGIMAIFLGYGLVLGVLGAGLGYALGANVVWNINELQELLGLKIWNPEVYYFDRAPSQVDPFETLAIMMVAVISSVVGALIPAYLAGRLNPVESLRYE